MEFIVSQFCLKIVLDQSGVEVTDPPFEWIEFRRKDGTHFIFYTVLKNEISLMN